MYTKNLIIYLLLLLPFLGWGQTTNVASMTRPTTATGPSVSANPTTITGMIATGGSAGTPVTDVITFSNLTAVITASTSTYFEVSVDGGSTYGTSKTFSTGSPYTVLVRIANGAPTGSLTGGTMTFATTGLSPNVIVNLSGFVSGSLSSSASTLSPVSTAGTQGASQFTTITGTALGTNAVIVSAAPTGYVQSLDNATWTTSALTITPSAGAVNQPVYYALASGNTAGSYPGTSTISCSGAGAPPITLTLNGTTSGSGSATLFAFSRTSRPLPTISGITIVPMVGDPFIANVSATGNGITCNSGPSGGTLGAWQATGSPLVASNDSMGMLGSAMPGGKCPDSLLYRGWLSVSTTNRQGDSALQTLSKPNLTYTGLTVGHTYTVTVYSSLNPRYSGFHSNVHTTIVGSTTQISATMTLLANTSNPITFTIQPDGTGTIKLYFFTDGASTSAFNGVDAVLFQP